MPVEPSGQMQHPQHRRRRDTDYRPGVVCQVNPRLARIGRYDSGWTAYDIFSEPKTVYIDYSGALQTAQIDNAEY